MSASTTAGAWESPQASAFRGSVFSGLDVAETARLQLLPGSPRPVFDHEIWNLTGLVGAPVVMGAHSKILDFTTISHPRWRLVAREYLLARIAPHHPAVATLPKAFRIALDPHSLRGTLIHLARWFNHLTESGVTSLSQVEQHHCDTYLAAVSRSTLTSDRTLSPGTVMGFVRVAQALASYSGILSDTYRPGFIPWAGRSATDVAGYTAGEGNSVPPVPDELLRPLLADALYLVDVIGPRLAIEAAAVHAFDERQAASQRGILLREIDQVIAAVDSRRQARIPAPRVPPASVAARLVQGWDPADPLLHMSWHPVAVESVGAKAHGKYLHRLRPFLQRWVDECGIAEPWCRDAALVPRHDTGQPVPWAIAMSREQLDSTIYAVVAASFLLTSALSGMRTSELAELAAGCRRQEQRPGGETRFRLVTRRIKGESFGGVQDTWVVIEETHRAIELAETLTRAAPGDLLFTRRSNTSGSRYRALRAWINSGHGQRLGLGPIPDGPVNPQALRRTLALAIAQRPHGLMAAKVALKHVSVATSEGYAARPGGQQAAFLADVTAAEDAEHLRLTVIAYDDYQRGVLPSGKGARELIASFKAVDQVLARHDPGTVTVIDDRRVERLLKAKAHTLHLGVGNYCWFTDPTKALCLKLAGTPDRAEPLIGMCDSARCPQATHHPQHRQVWADHANNTQTVFLGNPRLTRPERERAQATYDRARRIITEIDSAAEQRTETFDGQ